MNEQFEKKMNEDASGNRKLFWKEVNNMNVERLRVAEE